MRLWVPPSLQNTLVKCRPAGGGTQLGSLGATMEVGYGANEMAPLVGFPLKMVGWEYIIDGCAQACGGFKIC